MASIMQKEIDVHRHKGTFEYVPADSVPKGTMVMKPVTTFTYKYAPDVRITGHKVLLSYPGNCIQSQIDYEPTSIAVFFAER